MDDNLNEVVRDCVRDLARERGFALAALLKNRILRVVPGFREATVQYPSFREFLETVPGIRIVAGPHDLHVSLLESAPASHPHHRPLMVPDLWRAFTATDDHPAFFSRSALRVVAPSPGGPSDDLIQVGAISLDKQADEALRFLSALPETPASKELIARHTVTPFNFASLHEALNANPGLQAHWRKQRYEILMAHARSWAANNAISIDNLLQPLGPRSRRPKHEMRPSGQTGSTDIDSLRSLVRESIDYMTPEDLVSFRFPATYVLLKINDRKKG
jgi:hypothetical protein